MTDYTDFTTAIRKWISRPDYEDAVVLSFVRSAESYLDREMRVKESVLTVTAQLDADGKVTLPTNYNEMMYIRPVNGKPYLFKTFEVFFGMDNTARCYTIVGDQLIWGGTIDTASPPNVEMAYYQKIPAFSNDNTWLSANYYDIFLQSCCAAGLFYGQEFERSTALTEMVLNWVAKANGNSAVAQMSGSTLTRTHNRRIG